MAGLTPKQEKYVQGLVAGLSQRQAYIEAGYSTRGHSDTTIDANASRLYANSKVSARYNELLDEYKDKAIWTRETAQNELLWLLDKAKEDIDFEGFRQANSSTAVNVIKELNALNDVYPDKTQKIEMSGGMDVNNPFEGLTTEQLEKLADGYE